MLDWVFGVFIHITGVLLTYLASNVRQEDITLQVW